MGDKSHFFFFGFGPNLVMLGDSAVLRIKSRSHVCRECA